MTLEQIDELIGNITKDLYEKDFQVNKININFTEDRQQRITRIMLDFKILR